MSIKYALSALLISCASFAAYAKAPTVTLGGDLGTQYGYAKQETAFDVDSNGHRKSHYGIVNDTRIRIKADGTGSGFKYGGMIRINADTSTSKNYENSVAYQTMIYVESRLGRIEAGDYWGPTATMAAGGSSLGAATGGLAVWADWFYWFNYNVGNGNNIVAASLPVQADGAYSLNSSKVIYYTPVMGSAHSNFQAGVSYIPDTDQHGTITNLKTLAKSYSSNSYYGGLPARQLFGYTDVFQGGLVYKGKINNVIFRLSATGEIGDVKKLYNVALAGETIDRHKLRAYALGATMQYKAFGLGGSFGDRSKSGMYKTITNAVGTSNSVMNAKSGHYWEAGANYTHGAARASVDYLRSENGGFGSVPLFATPTYSPTRAKTRLLSFGVDYTVAPGFMPYAEVVFVNIHDKSQTGALAKNTGSVFLAGTKLHF